MQPVYLDVEAGTLNQPVRLITDPDPPLRRRSQWNLRWALLGTSLLLIAVAVLEFGSTTVPKPSVKQPTAAFTAAFVSGLSAPIQGSRTFNEQLMSAHKLKSPATIAKPVSARSAASTNMKWDGPGGHGGEPDTWAKPGWAQEQDKWAAAKQDKTIAYEPGKRNVPAEEAVTMFALMDLDGNGKVSEEEFRTYLSQFSYTPKAATRIFNAMDANGDGEISLNETQELARFVDGNSRTAIPGGMRFGDAKFIKSVHAEADRMFDIVDENGDGEISSEELLTHLKSLGYSEIASEAVMRSLDSNTDGKLSRSELQTGFEKYSALRQAVVELVKTLVKEKRWMPADYYPRDASSDVSNDMASPV